MQDCWDPYRIQTDVKGVSLLHMTSQSWCSSTVSEAVAPSFVVTRTLEPMNGVRKIFLTLIHPSFSIVIAIIISSLSLLSDTETCQHFRLISISQLALAVLHFLTSDLSTT